MLADPRCLAFYERDAFGAPVAAAVVLNDTILLICVDEAYRGKGLGSRLLAKCEDAIRASGYAAASIGAGEDYLAPGIPTSVKPYPETLAPERLYAGLNDDACAFFRRRGYEHAWGECNCFDMRQALQGFSYTENRAGDEIGGVTYRWALPCDMPDVCKCSSDAFDEFTLYYRNEALYSGQSVLIACQGESVLGAVIVSIGDDGDGLGSVGCTIVRRACRERGIDKNMVLLATRSLKERGVKHAFIGYTYSGLNRLYGIAGYEICAYYFMARKRLS